MYKQDLAIHNPQELICHKTLPTKSTTTVLLKESLWH